MFNETIICIVNGVSTMLPIGTSMAIVCDECKTQNDFFISKELLIGAIFFYGIYSKQILKKIIGK